MSKETFTFSKIIFACLTCINGVAYALPFNIFPKVGTSLPTSIQSGGSTTAFYTVQNNTSSTRLANFVKYLPLNVRQVFTDPTQSNLCGPSFNLTARGTPGDSCTLELQITGAVLANDPDPHHHLFVCLPGGATCAGTLFPLNVSINTGLHEVTVGFAGVGPLTFTPLAYFSNDTGNTWTLSSLPPGGILTGVTCIGLTCTTVGNNTPVPNTPLGYVSTNGGINWTLSSGLTPPPGSSSNLNGVSCVGSSCSAVGASLILSSIPLAYFSTNSGANWSLVPPFTLPVGATDGILTGVSCTGSNCATVGIATIGGLNLPLAYTSTDLGITWSAPITAFVLPAGATQGSLSGINCINNLCVAVGSATVGGVNNFPVAYTSNDSGNTWTLSPAFAVPIVLGGLDGVSCVNSHCVAVGFAGQPPTFANPLAYISEDNGLTWTASTLPPPASGNLSVLDSVKCYNANNCTAVGAFGVFGNTLPLAYTTINGGTTWSLVTNPFEVPSGTGELLSVS